MSLYFWTLKGKEQSFFIDIQNCGHTILIQCLRFEETPPIFVGGDFKILILKYIM